MLPVVVFGLYYEKHLENFLPDSGLVSTVSLHPIPPQLVGFFILLPCETEEHTNQFSTSTELFAFHLWFSLNGSKNKGFSAQGSQLPSLLGEITFVSNNHANLVAHFDSTVNCRT